MIPLLPCCHAFVGFGRSVLLDVPSWSWLILQDLLVRVSVLQVVLTVHHLDLGQFTSWYCFDLGGIHLVFWGIKPILHDVNVNSWSWICRDLESVFSALRFLIPLGSFLGRVDSWAVMVSGRNEKLPPHWIPTVGIGWESCWHLINTLTSSPWCAVWSSYNVDLTDLLCFNSWAAIQRSWPRALLRGLV